MTRENLVGNGVKTLLCITLFALVACQSTGPVSTDADHGALDTGLADEPQFVAEPGLTNRERLRKAINELSLGMDKQAEAELREYIANVVNSRIAEDLLRQINTPVSELYPEEFVNVPLIDGASLSSIAKDYLGDPLQFYGLARYNDIIEPGKTEAGQIIKVPLTDMAKKNMATLDSRVAQTSTPGADGVIAQKANQDVIQSNGQPSVGPAPAYAVHGPELVSILMADGDYEGAITEYEALDENDVIDNATLIQLVGAYRTSGDRIAAADTVSASKRYFRAGEILLLLDNKEAALKALNRSVKYNAGNVASKALSAKLTNELADIYHREASQAFRRQELDVAIELWEKVVVFDPSHPYASSNLMQAQELKAKLSNLE